MSQAQRDAFVAGADWYWMYQGHSKGMPNMERGDCEREAARRFPDDTPAQEPLLHVEASDGVPEDTVLLVRPSEGLHEDGPQLAGKIINVAPPEAPRRWRCRGCGKANPSGPFSRREAVVTEHGIDRTIGPEEHWNKDKQEWCGPVVEDTGSAGA